MRRHDKLKNMIRVNKNLQDRVNREDQPIQEEEIEYTIIPDIYPELSKILK